MINFARLLYENPNGYNYVSGPEAVAKGLIDNLRKAILDKRFHDIYTEKFLLPKANTNYTIDLEQFRAGMAKAVEKLISEADRTSNFSWMVNEVEDRAQYQPCICIEIIFTVNRNG